MPEAANRPADDAPVTASTTAKPAGNLFEEAVTINRAAAELYAFWREPAQLAGFMDNVIAIEPLDADRSRWRVMAPGGREVSWIARITSDVPGREISWQSEAGGDIDNKGRIVFEPAGARGTVVRATIAYDPPGGKIGTLIAKLFQREPRIQTRRDLHRFKQLMETGEVSTSARNHRIHDERYGPDGQPAGI